MRLPGPVSVTLPWEIAATRTESPVPKLAGLRSGTAGSVVCRAGGTVDSAPPEEVRAGDSSVVPELCGGALDPVSDGAVLGETVAGCEV